MGIKKIIVAGGGPAGMMAAIRASELGQEVTLIEKNPALGRKLILSGKGRCNLTNDCDLDSFLKRFSGNGQFLRDAFRKFFNRELMKFFEARALPLKVERQLRVFPQSNKSDSVLEVLKKELNKNKVKLLFKKNLSDVVVKDGKIKGVLTKEDGLMPGDALILATGGVSYGFTGSTGEGLRLAQRLGHRMVPLRGGLVPLETRQQFVRKLKGLALKNIRLEFSDGEKKITSEIGEMLFTDFGISGPLVLTLSSKIADWLGEGKEIFVEIDLKPALSLEQLDSRLLREFKLDPKKNIKNILRNLMPKSLVEVFLELTGIPPEKKANQVIQDERKKIINLLKNLRLDIKRARPIEEAMVTRGGVSLKDINPRTMESRVIKGLYFAGEIIDVDADTGGFNLQAAFSTGYLAGESAGSCQ